MVNVRVDAQGRGQLLRKADGRVAPPPRLKAGAATETVFRRLSAPYAAHTTQRPLRTCASCHNNPVALDRP